MKYLAFLLTSFFLAFNAHSETIDSFDAVVLIDKSGKIEVLERVNYNFGTEQKHGIFRDIPLAKNGSKINIIVRGVYDEANHPYLYTSDINNDILHIRIGDPNVLVTGAKQFNIKYDVTNVFRRFTDHDELYWNVSGSWPAAMTSARAIIEFVDGVVPPNVRMACFTGLKGSKDTNCESKVFDHASSSPARSGILYATTKPLNSQEELTIVLGLPPGYISSFIAPQVAQSDSANQYSAQDQRSSGIPISGTVFYGIISIFIMSWVLFWSKKNIIFGILGLAVLSILTLKIFTLDSPWKAIPILVIPSLIALGVSYYAKNRVSLKAVIPNELKNLPIKTEYTPPAGLSPADVGTLFNAKIDTVDLFSIIIDLAVHGYLKIHYIPGTFLLHKKDFEFSKIKNGADLTHPADVAMFNLLFAQADQVKLSKMLTNPAINTALPVVNPLSNNTFAATFSAKANRMVLPIGSFSRLTGSSIGTNPLTEIKYVVKQHLIKEGQLIGPDNWGFRQKLSLLFFCSLLGSGLIYYLMHSLHYQPSQLINIILGVIAGGSLTALIIIGSITTKSENGIKLSPKGISALAHILGFREFLNLTEKDKLKLLNAPELNAEVFEKYLPYAMVLGVDEQWCAKFKDICKVSPNWYEGEIGDTFTTSVFISELKHGSEAFNNYANPASSGFSSGSSGGGSGGGGGGSW